jgi:ferric-dicitrate binding protein FerR (iron transport regulator)
MEKEFYLELITRYLDNSITAEESELLLNWLKADKKNMDLFVEIKDLWCKSTLLSKNDPETELALLRFKYKITHKEKNFSSFKQLVIRYRNIAAILLIVILSSALIFKLVEKRNPASETVFNEIFTANGQKGQVVLSDGTKISLNSGTKLRYPSGFNQKKREVYLEGEAYFDVSHDKAKPFLVHSGKMVIKVLGTSFNIKSYPDERKIETTLVSGSVEILEVSDNKSNKISTLKPNEQAIYDKANGQVSIKRFNTNQINELKNQPKQINSKTSPVLKISPQVESIIQWKDQKLIFENETLEQMAQRLTRWYGKNVFIVSECLKKNRYSGKFIYNETIYQVLEVISLTTNIKYYEKNHEIFIMTKD